MKTESTGCVIAGGGPAGVMAGLLLSRAGVDVVVVEKHPDFNRDFRGDTVHASTIRLLDELGLGDGFSRLPQSRLSNFNLPVGDGETVTLGDFGRLSPPYDHVAMVPQWDLLTFLTEAAEQNPQFSLRMSCAVVGLTGDGTKINGVRLRTPDGEQSELHAELVLACDGRHSVLRDAAGLVPHELPVPFDTWWFRLPRHVDDDKTLTGTLIPKFNGADIVLSLTRDTYYQLAYFTTKGADARLRAEGVARFRQRIADVRPEFADRVDAITSMADLHLLDVRLNRLTRWHRPGLLCIGDAAHAMSPAGGVGINLAFQDAVAAATLLAAPLLAGRVSEVDLARVQRRRTMPTVVLQTLQLGLHKILFRAVVDGRPAGVPPVIPAILRRFPALAGIPARLIAFGPLPEHAPEFARPSP